LTTKTVATLLRRCGFWRQVSFGVRLRRGQYTGSAYRSGKDFFLQPPQPILVVDLFPEILEALLSLLGSLSADAWHRPTVCPGWCVQDVALHLLGVEVGNLARRRDGHAVAASIPSWDELAIWLNDFNEAWVHAARRMSPRLLVDLLQVTGLQMCAFVRALAPYALGEAVSWAGPEPAPVWLDLAREYTERWCHQQQIRDAVGQPGLTQPRYLAPVLATFMRALPRTLCTTPAAEGTVVTLTIRGASGGQWSVCQEEGAWRLYEGAPARPDAEVLVDEEMAWRLCTRGLNQAQAREQVTLRGDQVLASKVCEIVSIIA
jgi:uncharacterized protein (TIGR03083 family)